MRRHWHIPQTTLFWLIFTHTLAVIYFVDVVPLWLYGLSFIAIGWRLAVYLGNAAAPPRYLVVLVAVASGILLALLSSGASAMQLLIQLMLVGYGLKFIELKQRRDVYVLIMLGFFVIAVGLVVHQGMQAAAWLAMVMLFNTSALLTLQRPGIKTSRALGEVGRIVVISLPLTLILFLIVPRVTQLWKMPQLSNTSTGLSDSMAPGDLANLSRDPSLAFRVTFDNQVPSREQLYWRAIVLESFDGRRWSQDPEMQEWQLSQPPATSVQVDKTSLDNPTRISYEVIAEPNYQRWLYGLQVPDTASPEVINTSDYRLYANQPLMSRLLYRVNSYPQVANLTQLSEDERQRNLMLPDGSPQTETLIRQLRQQFSQPAGLIGEILRRFNQQPYRYTLNPPLLAGDTVDQFLFESRAGFCAHYAGAFTVMMRYAGIPARVVIGYQGGEWDSEQAYLSVYQYDAHAWSEVWLEGRGWIRIDPTAAVAPERVELGLEAAVADEETFLAQSPFSLAKYRDNWVLNQLRTTMADVDYIWSRWLLGYDAEQQKKLLQLLLGDIKQWKVSLMLGGGFVLVALWLLLTSGLRLRRRQPRSQRLYQAACDKLAKSGCRRREWEGPVDYAERVRDDIPDKGAVFEQFTECYVTLRYHPPERSASSRSQLTQMARLLRQL